MNATTLVAIGALAIGLVILHNSQLKLEAYHPPPSAYFPQYTYPNKHPSQMTTEELERSVYNDGICIGPGLVEGNRYRGNLNL